MTGLRDGWMRFCMGGWMLGWMTHAARMAGLPYPWMLGCRDGEMLGCLDVWTVEWSAARMVGCSNVWMQECFEQGWPHAGTGECILRGRLDAGMSPGVDA